MKNYRLTLNLPKTNFPMRADLINLEPKILARWINDDLYSIIRAAKKGRKTFILCDGPPYANGNIHLGHALNKILKDVIIKYKGLFGLNAPYIPGWDCHGLPIELKVEQKYGQPREKFTSAEFRSKCREYAKIQIDSQRKDFIRLGVLADWYRPYLTMDSKSEANIILTLKKIISNGHLYKKKKPVHWCLDCRSSLADAEIEYYKKTSFSIDVLFEAIDQHSIKKIFGCYKVNGPVSLVIWTTTPWTLPANCAVALASEFEYALVQLKNNALIIEKSLVERVMKRANIFDYTILSIVKGAKLELVRFRHPFLDYEIPAILGTHVKLVTGTGAVHVAGGHGLEDYEISLKYGLKIYNPVASDGTYLPGTCSALDGINVFKANKIIVELLNTKNALFHVEKLQHNYPYCWRHKSPTIFRATPQWFISMENQALRKELLSVVKMIKWIPDWGRTRMQSMIDRRPDWCISRQRVWGVPIPFFIHKETHNLHPRTLELMEKVAKRVEINGIQAWWDLDPYDVIGHDANCYEKSSDILDVWFDSGSMHTAVVDIHSEFSEQSIDMYLEGADQHRGWFMASLMISSAIKGKLASRQILTHGFTVDRQGRKMSKSIGNIISVQSIINRFGADVLRLWVASVDYTKEMVVSDNIFKHITDNYRRIRNTARFLLANLHGFDPEKHIVSPENMVALDRWAVSCAKIFQQDILLAYEAYDFQAVVQRLMHFCTIEMGSFYLEIIKDRQYTTKADGIARRSCQTALYHILEALVRWIAPIISFTADEIWRYIPGDREQYVFTGEWYKKLFSLDETQLMNSAYWNKLLKVRGEINKVIEQARKDGKLGGSLEAIVTLYAEPTLTKMLLVLGEELRFLFLTSDVRVLDYALATVDAYQSELFTGLKILLNRAEGKKCLRCWHYTTNIGQFKAYPNICERCVNNIIGSGEERRFI